jgi:hypothetical protein
MALNKTSITVHDVTLTYAYDKTAGEWTAATVVDGVGVSGTGRTPAGAIMRATQVAINHGCDEAIRRFDSALDELDRQNLLLPFDDVTNDTRDV